MQRSQTNAVLSLLMGGLLGLALFLSPVALHNNPQSIFFVAKTSANLEHTHQHHQDHDKTQAVQCLRCVLYGFELPVAIAPFIIIIVTLGFLILAKPAQPFSFISISKTARAPPVAL